MDSGFCKLSWRERLGLGSGELAQNLIYQTVMGATISKTQKRAWEIAMKNNPEGRVSGM